MVLFSAFVGRPFRLAVAVAVLVAGSATGFAQGFPTEANRAIQPPESWEATIVKFEEQDKKMPPPPNGIVFVGASSIVRWDLRASFPELGAQAINRGFGGSLMADSAHFAERIVIPYKPRIVVLYAGDNDIESPVSPEQIAAGLATFDQKVHTALPTTKILVISIKPSLRRWAFADKIRRANRLTQQYIAKHPHMQYVDIFPQSLGPDGKPRPELLVADGLHLTAEGYKVWTAALKPYLQ